MNLYEQQQANRRNTVVVMAAFVAFFAFLGLGFDYFYFSFDPVNDYGIPFPVATVATLSISSLLAWWGLHSGDRAVLSSTRAMPVARDSNNPNHQKLLNVVEEMSIASGSPLPKVYIVPDADPNAFATGRDPDHAAIAVTEGLLDKLNREELQGVVAHEMSHIRNYDIRLLTVIAALVGAIVLLSDFGGRMMRWGGGGRGRSRSSKGSGGGALALVIFVLWVVSMILAPILARILALAVSRHREYLADASAAEMTRNPLGLAAALEKIESAVSPTRSIKRGTAHLCIADPLGKKMDLREGFWADLLATHPPMPKRIAALKQMAYQN
ncbi:MAG TPA: M48 family metallopeptidase [bacterium]